MWRRVLYRRQICAFSAATETHKAPIKLYVIAGEASGDAIGAKVIRALQHHEPTQIFNFRGIGGPQMCEAGKFKSLFPMQELSIMGLLELIPHIRRFQLRIRETLRDIDAYQPKLILTIDSKGFTFRILKALHQNEQNTGVKLIQKVHYVAPSVWAYKHRNVRNFTQMKQLLDAMITILPFEKDLFDASGQKSDDRNESKRSWCHFVGHPAIEDFLEANGVYENGLTLPSECSVHIDNSLGADALLRFPSFNWKYFAVRGKILQNMIATGRNKDMKERGRKTFKLSTNAFVICALVGSRTNEVTKSLKIVVKAINSFVQKECQEQQRDILVVFPTIAAVKEQVTTYLSLYSVGIQYRVLTDLNAIDRLRLFQSSDVAVAVSGTVVLEATLAGLPTVVIYRANWFTEWIAKRKAAVRFVSIPNLLFGKPLIPELLFSNCTVSNIAEALRNLQHQPVEQRNALHLAISISTLTKWHETAENVLQPIRASEVAAKHIFEVLRKG
ncbi:lpxB [Plasmopara halstedii]|uniref:lipid-A-disaccharide synthase n=1 Tax=Plasmopara halstedii TaxID=4781 RepID=A0A0P1AQF3_PLAHL|nr:lpxB [Plasmopara halstedii]CEG43495.1 lpxB [Plasmopara halstedii]|eukprot:XP_024579864.1 lpxB [Plasmopara halstedii]